MPHILPCQHKLTQKKVRLIFRIEIIFFIHFILLCFLGNQTGVKNPELKAQLLLLPLFSQQPKIKNNFKAQETSFNIYKNQQKQTKTLFQSEYSPNHPV